MIITEELLSSIELKRYADIMGIVPGASDGNIIAHFAKIESRYQYEHKPVPPEMIQAKDVMLKNRKLMRELHFPLRSGQDPEYVRNVRVENYTEASKILLAHFPECGAKNEYNLANHPQSTFSLGCVDIVETMLSNSPAQSHAEQRLSLLDLGTGHGRVPAVLNEKFKDKVIAKGITSGMVYQGFDNPLGENLIFGNLENLADIPEIKDQKFHFIFSNHTFPYIGDTLNVICDAYEKLEPGGILFINHIYLHGLDDKMGQALISYLRNQNYEIVTGTSDHDSSHTRVNCWGPFFICMRKNAKQSLDLPLVYNGYTDHYLLYDEYRGQLLSMIDYKPQQVLLDYAQTHQEEIKQRADTDVFDEFEKLGIISQAHPVQNFKQLILNPLKNDISKLFDSYISFWKLSIFGHHHNERAKQIKTAIMNSKSLEEIDAILTNQLACYENEQITTHVSGLDIRWTSRSYIKHIPDDPSSSGYYRIIQAAKNQLEQLQQNPARKIAYGPNL